MKELNLHFDWRLRLASRDVLWGLMALLLCVLVGNLASENASVSPANPAPAGLHVQIVNSSPPSGPHGHTETTQCPPNYHLISCVVETYSADGWSYHYAQRIVYVDAAGHPTSLDPIGCYSASSDSDDTQVVHASCVSNLGAAAVSPPR